MSFYFITPPKISLTYEQRLIQWGSEWSLIDDIRSAVCESVCSIACWQDFLLSNQVKRLLKQNQCFIYLTLNDRGVRQGYKLEPLLLREEKNVFMNEAVRILYWDL